MAESDPPGVDAAVDLAVVGVVLLLAVVPVVDDFTVVVVVPPAAAVVVVVLAPACVVVVVECVLGLLFDFLVAEGVDEPHAAATRPPTRTTVPIAKVRRTRRRPLLCVDGESGVVCKVFLPRSWFVVLQSS